ncbi:hypothetical protein GCM10011446_23980 [Acinetobacter vivianii]|nr:hypothetical protein GCM10011446_23980 [Acinetobacter vivianii]
MVNMYSKNDRVLYRSFASNWQKPSIFFWILSLRYVDKTYKKKRSVAFSSYT